ncbi:MAG: hypothetical protein IJ605_07625 [Prevotella sp.]|nr:hypothetical protein [Prevotella sp.]
MTSKSSSNSGEKLMRAVCAMLFTVFTFCYLYFYQGDLIAAAQHIFSAGQTQYDHLIGAVLITLTLFGVHLLFLAITRLTYRAHALTYYPSLLALLLLTVIQITDRQHISYGPWLWVAPVLLAIVIFFAYLVRKYESLEKIRKPVGLFSKIFWSNIMLLCFGFFFVGIFSNHNDVLHYRLRMETLLLKYDYKGALEVGKKSLATDPSLTLLRTHALAKCHLLGERLFEFPLEGGAQALKPDGNSVQTIMYPTYKFVQLPESDYTLCAHLLNRNLDAFALAVKKYYAADSLLPKHYREALVLHNHLRSNPIVAYKNAVTDADYADFMKLMRNGTPGSDPRRNHVRDIYGNTYWYYYYANRQTR